MNHKKELLRSLWVTYEALGFQGLRMYVFCFRASETLTQRTEAPHHTTRPKTKG